MKHRDNLDEKVNLTDTKKWDAYHELKDKFNEIEAFNNALSHCGLFWYYSIKSKIIYNRYIQLYANWDSESDSDTDF